ncbi:hypothetical protein DESPIG_00230 [Desulfovibrio piger ATCC 29098]|uniref:Uncharacterized protein n=1 Tax=Desulfovibrio piger ATCC 29098 TaxID=411464 RepID=B6WQA6_9BACT|nr:hypothetical protein DESPIG_00230 [Desulfovibrio piger ATCC 29098]
MGEPGMQAQRRHIPIRQGPDQAIGGKRQACRNGPVFFLRRIRVTLFCTGKEDGVVAVTHRRPRGRAAQVPAVVLGKDAALADARDEAGMRLVVGLFRLLGDGRHALEHEAGAHTARLGSGIVGGSGDGTFPRGPAQTDIAVGKGRGKAFFHDGGRDLFHAGGCTGFKGIHGADMIVRRLIMTGKTAGTAGCQQGEAQKGGESIAAGHGISSSGCRDAAGKEGSSHPSSMEGVESGRGRACAGILLSGRGDRQYKNIFNCYVFISEIRTFSKSFPAAAPPHRPIS